MIVQSNSAVTSAVGVALASAYWMPAVPEHVPLVALSGLAGGICRMFAAKEKLWPQGFSSVVVGMLAATFLWPVGEPFLEPLIGNLEMEPEVSIMFGGFVTGLLGVSLIGLFVDFGRSKREARDDDE